MNQLCLLCAIFIPSGKDFLSRLLVLTSLQTHFLFPQSSPSLFDIARSSRRLHLCLFLPLPIYPPRCEVVIPSPLSLLSFTFPSIFIIISPPRPLVAPPVIRLSASM